jgi:hypothetical protein
MRFLTFIKNYPDLPEPNMIAFKEWFLVSGIATNNPHAGVAQIKLFVHFNDAPPEVVNGFYKWEQLFQKLNDRK